MDFISGKSLLTDSLIEVDLTKGVNWLVVVNENSCDEVFKMISLINEQDFESEIYGLLLRESEKAKAWALDQGIKINCMVLTDEEMKKKIGVKQTPWFLCIDNSKVVYSSENRPEDLHFLKTSNEDMPEQDSPLKKELENKSLNLLLPNSPLKASIELPNTSTLINKDHETELEKALKKVQKLKTKVKQHEQTIEDYKVEMKQLRFLLLEKNPEKKKEKNQEKYQEKGKESPDMWTSQLTTKTIEKKEDPQKKKNIFQNNKANNKVNKFSMRIDENDFWNIEDRDEFQESLKFEDIAASKDLWLMGLFRSQKEPAKILKPSRILPPLDKQRQAKSLVRDSSLKASERQRQNVSYRNAGVSSKKKIN